MESINIDNVMEEIRREVQKKPAYKEPVTFEEIPLLSQAENAAMMGEKYDGALLRRNVDDMGAHYAVPYYRPLTGKGAFFKRVLRRLLCFLLRPAMEEITSFQSLTAVSLNDIFNYIRDQEAENQRKTRKIEALEAQIAALEAEAKQREGQA